MGNYKIDYSYCYKNDFKNDVQAAVKFYLAYENTPIEEGIAYGFILYPQALNPFLRIMETMGESQNIVILPATSDYDESALYNNKNSVMFVGDIHLNKPAYIILRLDLKSNPIYTISSLNSNKTKKISNEDTVWCIDGTKISSEDNINFENLLLGLIKINKNQREKFKSNKLNYSAIEYAKEFCTIRLNIGRGVGKTNFINKYAEKGDLIITYNSKNSFLKKNYELNLGSDVIGLCGEKDMCHKLSKKNYINIFVEEPSIISSSYPDFIEDLYTFLVDPNIEQTFIILGE